MLIVEGDSVGADVFAFVHPGCQEPQCGKRNRRQLQRFAATVINFQTILNEPATSKPGTLHSGLVR